MHLLYAPVGPEPGAGKETMRIDLAAEQDFSIGPLRVSPSTREIFAGDARDVLEPRVMMVLIQLARAGGATVSRDQLIQGSWDGLAVSDDAINRVIGRLRKLAASSGAFSIETITKVGYRLSALDGPAPKEPSAEPLRARRRFLLPAALAILLAGGAVALWVGNSPSQQAATEASPEIDAGTRELIDNGRRAVLEHIPQRQEQGVALLREAVMRAPQSAEAWGALALGYVHSLVRVPHDRQPQVERQAEAAAARALELQPGEPMALIARARLLPLFGNWLERERAEEEAATVTGNALTGDFRGRFRLLTGRLSDALPPSEASISNDPSALYAHANRLQALWALGRIDEAGRESETILRLFPGNYLAWFQRFYFLLYSGQYAGARAMVEDKASWPRDIPIDQIEHCGRMIAAMENPDGPAADSMIADYDRLAPQGRGHMENAARIAAGLGRSDDAFRYMEMHFLPPVEKLPAERFPGQRNYGRPTDRLTDHLFLPPVDRLHADPRFLALLGKIGMVDYWRKSGTRPDFCDHLPAQCRQAGIPEKARARSGS